MILEKPFYYVSSVSWKRFYNREIGTAIILDADSQFVLDQIVIKCDARLRNFTVQFRFTNGADFKLRAGEWPLSIGTLKHKPGESILLNWRHETPCPWWKRLLFWFSSQHAQVILQGRKLYDVQESASWPTPSA